MKLKLRDVCLICLLILGFGRESGSLGQESAPIPAARLQFGEPTYRAKENAGEVRIDVRRSGNTNQSVSIHYSTRDGSAVSGKDYKESNGILNFAPGETNKAFRISVYNN